MHYLVSTLSCFSTLYLHGNHGLAGLCICLLIEVQPSSNVREYKLFWYSDLTCVILLMRADDRILPQDPVPLWQPRTFLSPDGAWTIQALTILWRVRRTFTLEVPHGFPCWLLAHTGLGTCVDLREPLFLVIAFSVSTLLVFSQDTARARHNLGVWTCPSWASKR
jgi:hypothetical protein